MDTEQLPSFVSASAGADPTTSLQQPQPGSWHSRSPSATSTATERPTLQLDDAPSYPRKPPSIDSNFSSVQGKTAGTPPNHQDDAQVDETVSSIWDESQVDKVGSVDAAIATPVASTSKAPTTIQQTPAPLSRPDWMTDDLDESWPEEQAAVQATPTPNNIGAPTATTTAAATMRQDDAQSDQPTSSSEPALPSDVLATPSVASRLPRVVAALSNGLPDPAFSAARRQARRALLKGRASGVGAPTPRAPGVTAINALQAGPSTPSLRLPSHQNRRNRLRSTNAENEEADSTIWSESESDPESDSASSAPDDFESARITNMQTAPQTRALPPQPTQSPTAASDASGAKGTFIHRADVSSLPPILRPVWQSPAKGQNGPNPKGLAGLGGDMFTPMRLQTMFKTPTPPEKPIHNSMSAVAGTVNPFTIPDAPTTDAQAATAEQPQEAIQTTSTNAQDGNTNASVADQVPQIPSLKGSTATDTIPQRGVPSSAFTFQSPHASVQTPLHVARAMVPSQSLHNMQTLHPNLHATALARPASAAADLGLHSPAVVGSAANLLSGPPTPHTPMRLFKFDYDNADTRAKLEKMVNQRTPAPAVAQPPTAAADVERERKRLRLDVKPRKVLTGDLMSMPMLGEPLPTHQPSQPRAHPPTRAQASSSHQQPVVDYVKESTDFMSALQHAVRVQSAGPDTSPEWATEEEESSGNGADNQQQISFHQGRADPSTSSPATSPARPRRSFGVGTRNRFTPQRDNARQDVVPSALERGSPQRLSSRRLPPDSSFITESSSNDIPMSSTLKSRASLSRRIAEQVKAGESPRKLLRRISAAAIAEEEVRQELEEQESEPARALEAAKLAEDAIAYRDEQIRQLEERIAKRRQLYTPAKVAPQALPTEQEPRTISRPQLITLHEPTLDAIAQRRQAQGFDGSVDESDADESEVVDRNGPQQEMDGNTRRFQDGIVLYDSERIPDPPLADPTRALRNMASAVELRNLEVDRASLARASSLLALPSQAPTTHSATADNVDPATNRRGDRTASSNTLVDPSNARTVSGDVGSQLTISDLDGKGATITRTGSLFNISQIPEQEIESLGRGKLTFNKELNRWEKVPRSRSSQEDLRSAAGSRNETAEGGFYQAALTSKTPIPVIPEASAELSRSIDVFSESAEEQQARAQAGGRTNSFQQRLGNLSQNNQSAADGRQSDSSDPFRDFESFGQSSHAPPSVSDAMEEDKESTPKPVKSNMFVSRQQHGANKTPATSVQVSAASTLATNGQPRRQDTALTSPAAAVTAAQPKSASPNLLAPRGIATSTVPRSSSSLRNVVTYSPESTISSRHSSVGQHAADARDELVTESPEDFRRETQATATKRTRDYADVYATPDRRLAHQEHLGTPTPRASVSSILTPKSILKQPAAFRGDAPVRLNGASHNTSANSGAGGGTPNRTISFADPPSTVPARDLGLAPSTRGRGALQRAQPSLDVDEVEDIEDGRTQAISSALKVLADLTLGDDSAVHGSANPTPSKMRDLDANRSHWSYRTLRRPRKIRPDGNDEGDLSYDRTEETYDELHGYPDMTLLTDASFNFAHDKVLEAITDVEPWEPGWDELQVINLSRRRLESCVRLKEFLPALEEVDLQNNELSYLTGIPASVRVLNVSHNRLTSMASFGHLLHLEELDISNNQIDTLTHLSCLKHLHTLKADNNAITSLDGIDKIRSLIHVSLSGNRLEGINLATTQWSGLETLDLSHNQLISIRGLHLKHRLKSLNLDHNNLNMVDLHPAMPRLRVLRVSGNVRLQVLDVAPAKRLRTLYADYCDLDRIENLDKLEHLDNLSMRQQADAVIVWPADQLRDVRRLFLSGNAFPRGITTTSAVAEPQKSIVPTSAIQPLRFLNLVYLELSACQLTQLPADLAEMAPNLRSLNLDHNLISTLPSLSGMQRLKRLSLVGCRVKKSKSIITAVRGLTELSVLDCRTNPCTLGLYAPLIAPSATPLHRGAEDGSPDLDALAPSWLPPVPNAQIVQPDLASRQRQLEAQAQRDQIELLERSHFHKRRPPLADYAIDPNATLAKEALEKELARKADVDGGASYSSLFLAADARFVKTLPKQFYERRVLHRGLLAMACPKLNWIDGLLVEEEEVELADDLVSSRRFDREPHTA